jgi:hypothetical protein
MKLNNQQLNVLPELPIDITYLDVSFNNLKLLDVSKYTNLQYLNCSNNLISELKVNDNLNILICKNNYLQSLKLNNICELDCSNNLIRELNINKLYENSSRVNNSFLKTSQRLEGNPECFLKKLLINDNKLHKLFYLPESVFSSFDTLQYLNINNNYLQYHDLINYNNYNDFQKIILDSQLNNQMHKELNIVSSNSDIKLPENINLLICENNKIYNHLNFINLGIKIIIPKTDSKFITYCYNFNEINNIINTKILQELNYKLNDNDIFLLQVFNTFILKNNKLHPINLNNFIYKNYYIKEFVPEIQDTNLKNIIVDNDNFSGYDLNNNLIKIYKNYMLVISQSDAKGNPEGREAFLKIPESRSLVESLRVSDSFLKINY